MNPVPHDADAAIENIRSLISAGRRTGALHAIDTFAASADRDGLHAAADLLQTLGEFAPAVALYRKSMAGAARVATLNNLAIALKKLGDPAAALDAFQTARSIGPVPPSVLNNIGNLSRQLGDIDGALSAFEACLAARPGDADTLNNYAAALLDAGRISDALAAYQQATAHSPDHIAASGRLYALHVLPLNATQLAHEHNAWGDRYASLADNTPFDNDRDSHRALRVGLISPNFESHPVGRFLLPLVEHIDRRAIAFFCYSDIAREDATTARFKQAAAVWRPIAGTDDAAVAKMIRDDQIDILIDLSLHLEGSRLKVFARRAAPVQATYMAYASTSGLAAMDFRLTDPYLDPPDVPAFFLEKPVRLAHSYWCYPAPPEATPVQAPPFIRNCYITFGCLNNFRKISAAALATWCALLKTVPQSQLIVHAHAGAHRDAFRAELAAHGIDSARVQFQAFENFAQYLASYHAIDIALDPFPYTGGTTSCDAMWMGVPVVTLAGATPVARGGVSILSNVGLQELIATDSADYIRIATGLASDPARLCELRSTLRQRMQSSPLMQVDRFCRDFETACRRMWQSHCKP